MEFTIAIPEDATFPLSVTLGASVKMPSPKVIELLVGSGEEDEHEAETSEKKKIQFGLKVRHHHTLPSLHYIALLSTPIHSLSNTICSCQLSLSPRSRLVNLGKLQSTDLKATSLFLR